MPRFYPGWLSIGAFRGPSGEWWNHRAVWPNRLFLKLLQVLLGIPKCDIRVEISSDAGVHEIIDLKAFKVEDKAKEPQRRSGVLSVNAMWIVAQGSTRKSYEYILSSVLLTAPAYAGKGYESKRLLVQKWWIQYAYKPDESPETFIYILTPSSMRLVENLQIRCYPLEDG